MVVRSVDSKATHIPRLNRGTVVTDTPVCIGNWCPGNYNRGSYAGSMPLTVAFAKSINTIPVIMSIKIGQATGVSHVANAAKIGRAKIIQTARAMGLTTPLTDTVSLPIGAAEVTVIDQAAGYAVFANGGKRARPYAAVEVRNSAGDVIYRHDSEKPPEQVLSTRVVADMSYMLNKVVEEGTGKRAMLDGVKAGGKTGTTNAYRDAWFVGFTGNLVGAVWMGNDDHTSTDKMTGGSVPAMLWREVMAYAHQNIELKSIPYLGTPGPEVARAAASGAQGGVVQLGQPTSGALSRRSFEVLGGIGALLKGAERPVAPLSTLPGSARARCPARRQSSGSSLPPCEAATCPARSCPTPNVNWKRRVSWKSSFRPCPMFPRGRSCRCESSPSSRNSARSNSG